MVKITDYIEEVGRIIQKLEDLGLSPVMIGGMALVILGSRRVTRDFDFLISADKEQKKSLTEIFYKRNFELASKIDKDGNIAHFLNRKTGLRIDLLFDFPLPAEELASRAEIKKIRSYAFRIASKKDLLRLKEMAHQDRSLAADAQDLEFLKKL